jgi:DNA primase
MINSKYKLLRPSWKKDRIVTVVDLAKRKPIEELYEGKLRKTGRVLIGLCPFHEEKTPSFVIYPENNSWFCFAEGIGGDVISYYMKKTGLSFVKAVEELEV